MHKVADLHMFRAFVESGNKRNSGAERDCRSAPFEGYILSFARTSREDQNNLAALQNIDCGFD